MTDFLLRLFVKDYENTGDPTVHSAIGKLAGTTGIVCNVLLFFGKLIAGILSGSIAIVADAVNNLSDAGSSVVTLLGFQLARRPADREHPYGHARYEYLSGLVVAALVLVVGAELAKSSFLKILHPEEIVSSPVTIAILVVSILAKLWLSRFFLATGKRIHSTTLQASSVDSRNDVIATAAVLAGYVIFSLFHLNLDGIVGLAVALFILWSGVGVARDTVSPLLGSRADEDMVKKISGLVLSHEKILGIHDLMVHDYGPGQCFASLHAELDAREDPLECHDIIDGIEQQVYEALNVHLVIHYDPVVTDDQELNEAKALVTQWVNAKGQGFNLHDFRMVRGSKQSKLLFDLVVPYGTNPHPEDFRDDLEKMLHDAGRNYTTIIHMERQF